MKIYQLHNNSMESGYRTGENRRTHNGPESRLKKAAGGEDIVELSAEAMEKFKKVSIREFEKAGLKKATAGLIDEMKRSGIYDEFFHLPFNETGTINGTMKNEEDEIRELNLQWFLLQIGL